MKRPIIIIISMAMVCLISSVALADYAGNLDIEEVRVIGGTCYVGVSQTVTGTCANFGEDFKFDAGTAEGKTMYALLVVAKMAGNPVDIWYTVSIDPGPNCVPGDMAVMTGLPIE